MKSFKEIALNLSEATIDYDIQKRYNYFNRKLFDNKLPKVPLKFRRTKQTGGAVVHNTKYKGRGYIKTVTSYEIKELYLSTFFLKTSKHLDQILVHEMIHVWMMENGYHEGINVKYHGSEFVQKKNELQHKVDFEIPMEDNLSTVIRDVKNKKYGIVIAKSVFGNSFVTFSEKTMDKEIDNIFELLQTRGTKGTEYHIGYSTSPELEAYKVKRSITKLEFSYMKDELKASLDETFEMKFVAKPGQAVIKKITKFN